MLFRSPLTPLDKGGTSFKGEHLIFAKIFFYLKSQTSNISNLKSQTSNISYLPLKEVL
jgi:hypothetical protein